MLTSDILKRCNNDNFKTFVHQHYLLVAWNFVHTEHWSHFFFHFVSFVRKRVGHAYAIVASMWYPFALSLIGSDEIGGCSNYCTVLIHTRRKEYRLDIFNQTGRCPAQSLKNFSLSFSLLKIRPFFHYRCLMSTLMPLRTVR